MLISYFQFLEDLAVICIDRNFLLCFMYMDDIKKNIGKDVIDDTFAERLKIQGNRDRTEDVAAYRQNERKKKCYVLHIFQWFLCEKCSNTESIHATQISAPLLSSMNL